MSFCKLIPQDFLSNVYPELVTTLNTFKDQCYRKVQASACTVAEFDKGMLNCNNILFHSILLKLLCYIYNIFMACRVIPIIAFYYLILVSLKLHHSGVQSINGCGCKRMHAQATDQQEDCKSAANTNNCCVQQRNSIKIMQKSLASRYSKLLSFRHEEGIIQNLEGVLHLGCSQLHFSRPQFSSTQKSRDTILSAIIYM